MAAAVAATAAPVATSLVGVTGKKRARVAAGGHDGEGADAKTGRRVISRTDPAAKNHLAVLMQAGQALLRLPLTSPEARMYRALQDVLSVSSHPFSSDPLHMIRYIKAGRADVPAPRLTSADAFVQYIVTAIREDAKKDDPVAAWDDDMAESLVSALAAFGETAVFEALGCGDLADELVWMIANVPQLARPFLALPGVAERLRTLKCDKEHDCDREHDPYGTTLFVAALSALEQGACKHDAQDRFQTLVAVAKAGGDAVVNCHQTHPLIEMLYAELPERLTHKWLFRRFLDECVALDGTGMRLIGAVANAPRSFCRVVRLDDFKLVPLPPSSCVPARKGPLPGLSLMKLAARCVRPLVDKKIKQTRRWCRALRRAVAGVLEARPGSSQALGLNMWSVVATFALHPSLFATALSADDDEDDGASADDTDDSNSDEGDDDDDSDGLDDNGLSSLSSGSSSADDDDPDDEDYAPPLRVAVPKSRVRRD